MGRPRKPVEEHFRAGRYRPSRHGPLPDPDLGPPAPPARPRGLKGDARRLWDLIVGDLAGVLRPVDGPVLELLVWHRDRMRAVEGVLAGVEVTDPNYLRLLRAHARLALMFDRIAARFGMTPADSRRLPARSRRWSRPGRGPRSTGPAAAGGPGRPAPAG